MDVTHSTARRNKILEFIIQTYVETAEPVGSHEVCRRFHLRLSPATVRNVMGALEAEALLMHPHTSAGRIPTDEGYRYYVNLLMAPERLPDSARHAIQALAEEPWDDPSDLLKAASHVLAERADQASMVLPPRLMQSAVRRVDLIPVDPHRVLGLLITTEGWFRHAYLEFEDTVDTVELARISRFFNEELTGQPLGTVEGHLQQALLDASNAFNHLYRRAQELWALGGFAEAEELLLLEGLSHLLAQPECEDRQWGRQLVEAVEHQSPLTAVLEETMREGRRRIVIGRELQDPALSRCSMVSAPYRMGSRVVGAVGVVGPTRMPYSRIVPVVEQVAEAIGRGMERFAA